ncbi:MAG: SapC family protein [Gammaproteobacteria bacterium]
MSKTLLIYERAVPITKARHGNWGVKIENDFGFARNVNSMPLLAQEFRSAVREYPIVFAGLEEQIMPVILLGIRDSENLYIDESNRWNSKYIPAFARRYPYVFSSADQGKTLTLCIDEEFKGISQDGDGERLFTEEGEQTPYLDSVLEFQKEYQKLFQRTQTFCKHLRELNLLDSMQAQLNLDSGEQMAIAGFMAVNRDRLKELSAEKLSELSGLDELELIYLHLHSMLNVSELASRIKPGAGDISASVGEAGASEIPTTHTPKKIKSSSGVKGSSTRKKKSVAAKKKAASVKPGNKSRNKSARKKRG